jgi:uncharacterized protein
MMLFEWDRSKAETNKRKHGVTFEVAMQVFSDPFALAQQDRVEENESRWQTIGMVAEVVILLVAHTVQDDEQEEVIRIISARRATRKERTLYEENRQKNSS